MSINPKKPTKGVTYLALTFGTLLSSQGADALVLQPSRPSFEAVSPMYTVLRSGRTSGVCPAVSQACDPVCSRSVQDRKSTRLNSSHANISYAVFCLKKKKH